MSLKMKRRGHPEDTIRKVVYDNPLSFWRQCARWQEWTPAKAGANGSSFSRDAERSGAERVGAGTSR